MRRARRAAFLLGAAWLLACAGLVPRDSGPRTGIAVEILSGAPAGVSFAAAEAPEDLHLFLDVRSSMQADTESGVSPLVGAKAAAVQLLGSLPEGTEASVHALGYRLGLGCAPPVRVGAMPDSNVRELTERIEKLEPRSDGSLAGSLRVVARLLGERPEAAPSRVVVFSNLGDACGGDLCQAASELGSVGARLDLVLFGDPVLPACLDTPPTLAGAGRAGAMLAVDARPLFRVRRSDPIEATQAVAEVSGTVGGPAVEIEPGRVEVVVDMAPPGRIGPLYADEGRVTRVRVLDFPGLRPPVREWRVE